MADQWTPEELAVLAGSGLPIVPYRNPAERLSPIESDRFYDLVFKLRAVKPGALPAIAREILELGMDAGRRETEAEYEAEIERRAQGDDRPRDA